MATRPDSDWGRHMSQWPKQGQEALGSLAMQDIVRMHLELELALDTVIGKEKVLMVIVSCMELELAGILAAGRSTYTPDLALRVEVILVAHLGERLQQVSR